MIGETVSHYKILEKLGGGGMGVVYRAEDTRLKRTVALKFLPPELTCDSGSKDRFVHEAQAASALQHNNICSIHDIDETDDGQLFLVMDCYEGETLKMQIAKRTLPFEYATDIAVQIAHGLQKAHEKGIVHRDIKPANIIITKDGVVKILDFGLAKLAGEAGLSKAGSIVGTAAYMSPEQARGEEVDHRTDIWSLGVVLYEMVAGRQPFASEFDQALIYLILKEEPPPIADLRSDVPPSLVSVVTKAIQKDRNKRYQHAAEFLMDLKSLGEQSGDETPRKRSPIERTQPSIAVLPFANLSADKEYEYFSDGMSEEIINALTKVNGLHVVARTSSFAFKGKNEDIREIGKKLHVEHVLEGSVRRSGNRLRITAQLIKIADGYHLWSERFDRQMDDVFAVQDEISLSIVDKLKVTLLEEEKGALVKRSTENLQAYHLLLQGRYSFHKSTRESLQNAIEKFQEAIAISPDYAQAYAEMAVAYHFIGLLNLLPSRDVYPKARASALKALEIDPNAAEAYAVLAMVNLSYDWDWEGAESAFRKAIELNSNAANVRVQHAMFLVYRGSLNEALAEMTTAFLLDPLLNPTYLGFVLLRIGRLDEARFHFKKSLESELGPMAPWMLGHVDVLQGRYEEGLASIQRALFLSGNNAIILAGLGWSNAVAGRRDEAIRVLDELHERSRSEYIGPLLSAKIYSALGENDLAFEWLERAYEEHDSSLVAILNDESFKSLDQDPRFDELLKKMKLNREH
jgi:serine/threonine protein kinase